MHTVRFTGGPMNGAVIRCTPEAFQRVNARAVRMIVTPGGMLYDQIGQRPVRGAELVEPPLAHRPAPQSRRRRAGAGR